MCHKVQRGYLSWSGRQLSDVQLYSYITSSVFWIRDKCISPPSVSLRELTQPLISVSSPGDTRISYLYSATNLFISPSSLGSSPNCLIHFSKNVEIKKSKFLALDWWRYLELGRIKITWWAITNPHLGNDPGCYFTFHTELVTLFLWIVECQLTGCQLSGMYCMYAPQDSMVVLWGQVSTVDYA